MLWGSSLKAQGAYYHLVAGSFDNFQSAKELAEVLKEKNMEPLILFPQGDSKYYRVSVYHGLDRKVVKDYSKTLKSSKSYWILTQKDPAADAAASASASPTLPETANIRKAAPDPDAQTFHLVVSSFKTFNSANAEVQRLTGQGFKPYVIYPGGGSSTYRVSLYTSQDRKEVETYSSMLKRRGKNPGWVFTEKPGTTTTKAIAGSEARLAPGQSTTFHLVGGSFSNFTKASAYAEEMRGKGFDPLIMFPDPNGDDSFRVSIYRSTQRSKVTAYQQGLAKQGKSKGWIFEQN